ncbi:hypothetical protein ACE1TI_20100 [Alteribacillus sp. JSM 102045]|uniref:hypothetical protein n=1 Tax=Alteribacillus sp. JSM 102045 TaxID=1562101 RepID=UPI0035C12E2B
MLASSDEDISIQAITESFGVNGTIKLLSFPVAYILEKKPLIPRFEEKGSKHTKKLGE